MENRTTRPLRGEGKKCPGPRRGSPSVRRAPFWKSGRREKKKRKRKLVKWFCRRCQAVYRKNTFSSESVTRTPSFLPSYGRSTLFRTTAESGELVARAVDVERVGHFDPKFRQKVDLVVKLSVDLVKYKLS